VEATTSPPLQSFWRASKRIQSAARRAALLPRPSKAKGSVYGDRTRWHLGYLTPSDSESALAELILERYNESAFRPQFLAVSRSELQNPGLDHLSNGIIDLVKAATTLSPARPISRFKRPEPFAAATRPYISFGISSRYVSAAAGIADLRRHAFYRDFSLRFLL